MEIKKDGDGKHIITINDSDTIHIAGDGEMDCGFNKLFNPDTVSILYVGGRGWLISKEDNLKKEDFPNKINFDNNDRLGMLDI